MGSLRGSQEWDLRNVRKPQSVTALSCGNTGGALIDLRQTIEYVFTGQITEEP